MTFAFSDEVVQWTGSNVAELPDTGRQSAIGKSYRIEQELSVPPAAKFLRVAVRDQRTGNVGAMELPLPLVSNR